MKKGFTLLEVLVVITIIGIMSAVGITSYTGLTRGARDARRKADLEQMRGALEQYRSANGSYPTTGGSWRGMGCSSYNGGGTLTDTGVNGYISGLAPTYMAKLPHDPREGINNFLLNANCTAAQTCYLYDSDGIDYKLLAHCTPENTISGNDPYQDPSRSVYSYAVWSSNTSRLW